MEIVRLAPRAIVPWPEAAVTVGNFDGLHRGHQALAAAAREEAAGLGILSVALTFDPHPSRVLSPHRSTESLVTFEQKAELMAGAGLDRLAVLPFDRDLAERPAAEFAAKILRESLGARVVVVGTGFRFGRERRGDVPSLTEMGTQLGFRVRAVAPVEHEGQPISSTRIRAAVARGAVEAAAEMLGRPHFIDGKVVTGLQRGRTLGFPTANVEPVNESLPGNGVYAGWCRHAAGRAPAVVNVGRRPTFGGGDLVVEAHLLGFGGDLYGQEVRVEFHHKLRDERAFSGPEALRAQIDADVAAARAVLGQS